MRWDWCSWLVETVWETNFVGEAFMVEWAIFVGWAPNWEGCQYWLNNLVDAENIGRWGYEGFVGIYELYNNPTGVYLQKSVYTRDVKRKV